MRVAVKGYSVDPAVIGRFVDVHAGLDRVVVTCVGMEVGSHQRSWDRWQTITDATHVAKAALMREKFGATHRLDEWAARRCGKYRDSAALN
ncbi:hypothetical protein EH165_06060 [Nakamurella antarctica]|uniref:Transposase for insertion sequence element IS21-like C-terminal domain-containing protein n=1 Tax=Nakamurella antarctica TaxID=1902245 RepID=A0A3G8ZLS0_9ACTN|nr:hypothetical protein [Nakamurella antarctica]AZI57775.1 hypothetical protein EH165_06060 [Nakamurella antarctica]